MAGNREMVYFRKRLTPGVLGEINEIIVRDAKERQEKEAESKDDDALESGGDCASIIVDATCAPSNVRYPQDILSSIGPGRMLKSSWMFS